MCNHTNDPGGREGAMVVLDPGAPGRNGRDGVWCDPCLVPLVRALNAGGVRTIASCCGHGTHAGGVALADGRWLLIAEDWDEFDRIDAARPGKSILDREDHPRPHNIQTGPGHA